MEKWYIGFVTFVALMTLGACGNKEKEASEDKVITIRNKCGNGQNCIRSGSEGWLGN